MERAAQDDGEPDDWPLAHAHARELDASLRCGVCRELLTTPLRLHHCPHVCACLRRRTRARAARRC